MIPPDELLVTDRHGGFTAVMRNGGTLWRPGVVAKRGLVGTLVDGSIDCDDFYQLYRPVVSALYKLPGYGYRVKVWWHIDGRRIA